MFSRSVIQPIRQVCLCTSKVLPSAPHTSKQIVQCRQGVWANCIFFRDYSIKQCVKVGDSASLTKTFSEADVKAFADITLDHNPIHIDAQYAKGTRFEKPIVHGILSLGLVGGVLGMHFPGPGSILLSKEMSFPAPLYVGEQLTAEVKLVSIEGRKGTFEFHCYAMQDDGTKKTVVTGKTHILIPKNMLE